MQNLRSLDIPNNSLRVRDSVTAVVESSEMEENKDEILDSSSLMTDE